MEIETLFGKPPVLVVIAENVFSSTFDRVIGVDPDYQRANLPARARCLLMCVGGKCEP